MYKLKSILKPTEVVQDSFQDSFQDFSEQSYEVKCQSSESTETPPTTQQLHELSEENSLLREENDRLKQELNYINVKFRQIDHELKNLKQGLSKYFGDQQMKMFNGAVKVARWDEETIKKAIVAKAICGDRKLDFIRKLLPFPSSSVIRRHLAEIPFEVGLQKFTLEMTREQCQDLQKHERQFFNR